MINEEEMGETAGRARALGTDYAVLAGLLRLMSKARCLRVPVAAAERLTVERLHLREGKVGLDPAPEGSREGRRPQATEIQATI